MPLVPVAGQRQQYARVIKTEEKGSDVNLATHLLHDAHRGWFEAAVIVSNDSDLLEPIKRELPITYNREPTRPLAPSCCLVVSCNRSRRRSLMPMLPRWRSRLNVDTEIE